MSRVTATLERVCTSGICSPRRAPAARSTPRYPMPKELRTMVASTDPSSMQAMSSVTMSVPDDGDVAVQVLRGLGRAHGGLGGKGDDRVQVRPEVELLQRLPVGPLPVGRR